VMSVKFMDWAVGLPVGMMQLGCWDVNLIPGAGLLGRQLDSWSRAVGSAVGMSVRFIELGCWDAS
jgi:hypothetical protein